MTKKTLKIGGKTVCEGQPVFIIAEAGVNHNGDVELAKKLVDAAKEAGADAVKFQNFEAEEVTTEAAEMAEYQKKNTGKSESQIDMIRKFELGAKDFEVLAQYAKEKGILFLSTPHSGFRSVDLLIQLQVSAIKFGSADLNNLPVLDYAAQFKKPMIISTGMADESDVAEAIECIRRAGNDDIIVFQCTTDYPVKPEEINLLAMPMMGEKFDVIVGYSDHTVGPEASIVAVALGARVLEKHLTLDNEMEGPDHKASSNPEDFKKYVLLIRDAEKMLGSAQKTIADSSRQYIPLVLKSVVARGEIKKGEIFTKENLAIKRPAAGLEPKYYWDMLGKQATRDLVHDEFIKKEDYE